MTTLGLLGRMLRASTGVIVLVAGLGTVLVAQAQEAFSACGPLRNGYGPYDYRTDRSGSTLSIVETYHFTPNVEALIKGNTSTLGGDLDYTLRAFPNHHRALLALMRLGKRTKSTQPAGLLYSVECYFDRAIRFRPDDTTVRMIYATFLFDSARPAEADAQLEQVDKRAGDDAFTHYNVGLIYIEHKNFDKALDQAKKAYALGFTRPELREQLKAAGKWSSADPEPDPAAASAAIPASGPDSNAHK
jgi:uncharacterized protein (TIGR02996 family)